MTFPRLVVCYATGLYQILGELTRELADHPLPLIPVTFDDHVGTVVLDRCTPTYVLYREVVEPVTLESGASHAV